MARPEAARGERWSAAVMLTAPPQAISILSWLLLSGDK